MEDLKSAMEAEMEQMVDLVQKLSSELRSGLRPTIDNFIGTLANRVDGIPFRAADMSGVYLAERINRVPGNNRKRFASQNYFDPHGLFLSALWSGPLLIIAAIILINTLVSLCYMIVRWKRAELRHRARLVRESSKQD